MAELDTPQLTVQQWRQYCQVAGDDAKADFCNPNSMYQLTDRQWMPIEGPLYPQSLYTFHMQAGDVNLLLRTVSMEDPPVRHVDVQNGSINYVILTNNEILNVRCHEPASPESPMAGKEPLIILIAVPRNESPSEVYPIVIRRQRPITLIGRNMSFVRLVFRDAPVDSTADLERPMKPAMALYKNSFSDLTGLDTLMLELIDENYGENESIYVSFRENNVATVTTIVRGPGTLEPPQWTGPRSTVIPSSEYGVPSGAPFPAPSPKPPPFTPGMYDYLRQMREEDDEG